MSRTETSRRLRAAIFDRDGVLTHFDFRPVLELFRAAPSVNFQQMWDRWGAWYPQQAQPRTVEAEKHLLGAFWDLFCDENELSPDFRASLHAFDYTCTIKAFPDARRALESAREQGLRIAVLSNFPLASLEESLRATGLLSFVDVVAPASVIGASKPAPQAYQYALDRLGVTAHECVMVDDESPCVEGARALGIAAWKLDRRSASEGEGVVGDLDGFTRSWLAIQSA